MNESCRAYALLVCQQGDSDAREMLSIWGQYVSIGGQECVNRGTVMCR